MPSLGFSMSFGNCRSEIRRFVKIKLPAIGKMNATSASVDRPSEFRDIRVHPADAPFGSADDLDDAKAAF
ncbi:hypothetical protein [Bradyrhizobium yuanmingense]|uniref:hypothetical protein n=1 Tax=Bradyrhizobium yuanmingense TaxID=108015 RepID=UPI0023B8ECD1|nr:hypothetical protein [Bradyrhizobium yuanmingense]MDF0492974.1 hypothetical protein [Bradyrhizobium yuanmingense]